LKKICLGACLIFIFAHVCLAQKAVIDSIRAQLPSIQKNDSIYYFYCATKLIPYYYRVNIDSSIYFITQSIAVAQRKKWQETELELHGQLAFAYNQKGNIFKAIDINYKAMIIAEKNKKINYIYKLKRVLGESYLQLKKMDKAEKYLLQAKTEAVKARDNTELLGAMISLGNLYQENKQFDKAKYYFIETIHIAQKHKEKNALAIARHNLGSVYAQTEDHSNALAQYALAEKHHKSENQLYSLANIQIDIAVLYFKIGNYTNSLLATQKAENYATKSNTPELLAKANYWYYKNYDRKGNATRALGYYERYNVMKDSLNFYDQQKTINSLQFEYDNSQKTLEIAQKNTAILKKNNENLILQKNRNYLFGALLLALISAGFLIWNRQLLKKMNHSLDQKVQNRTQELASANTELIKKNEEISEALFKGQTIERKRVAAELHDNLSSILSALNMSLQAIKTERFTDSEKNIYQGVLDMMGTAYNEVRNISHNILPENLEKEGLIFTLQNLIEKINKAEIVTIKLNHQGFDRLDPKIELNLYSICLELINNIIKHSKAVSANLSLKAIDNQLIVQVTDNGIGLTAANRLDGNGLTNIKNRVAAMAGQITYDAKENLGTTVVVCIPL
jgi:signal transduction histidine kinase